MRKLVSLVAVCALTMTALVGCGTTDQAEEVAVRENVLGVIGAMDEEVEILKELMDVEDTVTVAGMEFYVGTLEEKNIVLVKSGVGKVNMAACTQILVDQFDVAALLNSGVAGTLDPTLEQGDIVISTDAVQHDFDTTVFGDPLGEISRLNITFFEADTDMIETAKAAAANVEGVTVIEGRVATGDQFIAGGELAERIEENFGAVAACEMEGAAMAHVAYLNDVPFIILRAISDKANGGAELSYAEFLPLAAANASSIVYEFIKLY